MINSYKQLTGKYLKSNKKRSLLTIIGIVLSVALISSIGLFIKGIQDAQIEDTKNKYGSYHLMFSKTNEDLINKISNNPKVSRSGLLEGAEAFFDENTISVYIKRIREKLEDNPKSPEYIVNKRGLGYKWAKDVTKE